MKKHAVLGTLVLIAGCGPSVSKEELGTIVFEIPSVPGADQPYELPSPEPEPADESPPP